ncbi:MAG TPA: hypothetical protein VEX41_10865 [Candidatus Eisenbacteria bacterium]|nr:hypothetical protein [Candidatus Eisenbacteria bacterium]
MAKSQVEIYLAKGVLCGTIDGRAPVHDDLSSPFDVIDARWYPTDGGAPERRARQRLMPDDAYLVVISEPDVRVHSTWHVVKLDLGPYRVSGRLPTPPGFDPARALARPKGQFVGLRDAGIELLHRPDAAVAERANVLVNRYLVDRAVAPLMLGFYFPGAIGELSPLDQAEAATVA